MNASFVFVGQAALQVSQSWIPIITDERSNAHTHFVRDCCRNPEPSIPSILVDKNSGTLSSVVASLFKTPLKHICYAPTEKRLTFCNNLEFIPLTPSFGSKNNFACGYEVSTPFDKEKNLEYDEETFSGATSKMNKSAYSETKMSRLDETMSILHKTMEKYGNTSLDCIFLIFSTAGGTGSGLSARLAEELRDLYHKMTITAVPIWPFWNSGDTSIAIYNTVLSTAWMQEYADLILVMENDALVQEAGREKASDDAEKSQNAGLTTPSKQLVNRCFQNHERAHNERTTFETINFKIAVTLMHLLKTKSLVINADALDGDKISQDFCRGLLNQSECVKSTMEMVRSLCPVPSTKLVSPFCSYCVTKTKGIAGAVRHDDFSFVSRYIQDSLSRQLLSRKTGNLPYKEPENEVTERSFAFGRAGIRLKENRNNLTLSAEMVYRCNLENMQTSNFVKESGRRFQNILSPMWDPSGSISLRTTNFDLPEVDCPSVCAAVNWKPLAWTLHDVTMAAERKLKHRIYLHHYETHGFGLPAFTESLSVLHDVLHSYNSY